MQNYGINIYTKCRNIVFFFCYQRYGNARLGTRQVLPTIKSKTLIKFSIRVFIKHLASQSDPHPRAATQEESNETEDRSGISQVIFHLKLKREKKN